MQDRDHFIARLAIYAPISGFVWGLVSCAVLPPDWSSLTCSSGCGVCLGGFFAFLVSLH